MRSRELLGWLTIQLRQYRTQDARSKPRLVQRSLAEGREGTIRIIAGFARALVPRATVGTRAFVVLVRSVIAMRMAGALAACAR